MHSHVHVCSSVHTHTWGLMSIPACAWVYVLCVHIGVCWVVVLNKIFNRQQLDLHHKHHVTGFNVTGCLIVSQSEASCVAQTHAAGQSCSEKGHVEAQGLRRRLSVHLSAASLLA